MKAAQNARLAIIVYSICIMGFLLIFLGLAQVIGMRFDYSKQENLRLIDVVIPTFLGYLGSASQFIFRDSTGRTVRKEKESLLKILVHAPFWIFILFVGSLFYIHYWTHLPTPVGGARVDPLQFDALSRYLALAIGILSATINVISANLFGTLGGGDGARDNS